MSDEATVVDAEVIADEPVAASTAVVQRERRREVLRPLDVDQLLSSFASYQEMLPKLLAESDSIVITCPTTEGNLGDGHLPGMRYRDAGVRLAIGTDSQVRIDPFEELREMEMLARRERQTRFALLAAAGGDLWGQTAANGRASLGRTGAGAEIEIDLDDPSLAGVADEDLGLALATCASATVVRR